MVAETLFQGSYKSYIDKEKKTMSSTPLPIHCANGAFRGKGDIRIRNWNKKSFDFFIFGRSTYSKINGVKAPILSSISFKSLRWLIENQHLCVKMCKC